MAAADISEADIGYEEDVRNNRYSVKAWLRYLEHKTAAPARVRFVLYERALRAVPGSYKLWYRYLQERLVAIRATSPDDASRAAVTQVFERALVFMHKMPRIWLDYLDHMGTRALVTARRRAFDECLRALPITQHHRIWPRYLDFVRSHGVPETAARVYRRYLQLEPQDAEEYIDWLVEEERIDAAAAKLRDVLDNPRYQSKKGKTRHQMWMDLCRLVSEHPDEVVSVRVEPVLREGLRRFTDMVGSLWCALADFHIGRGSFEKARDVYEEALQSVHTVRDFSQVFEAYSGFEEETLASLMANAEAVALESGAGDLELRMARFEALMQRRPLLLSNVLLRQNPHAVDEWIKRVALLEGEPERQISTYAEAVTTVDPHRAVGGVQQLWVSFARLYEAHTRLDDARAVLDRALMANYRTPADLAHVYCEYAEMELRAKQYQRARSLLQRATASPDAAMAQAEASAAAAARAGAARERVPVQARVHRVPRLWSFYVDLEESLGTFESTRAVYNRMLDLRVASPQTVINYATFLEEHKHFEAAFAAFERGRSLFRWPQVYDIWSAYLTRFVSRYGGSKPERVRELFAEALDKCPAKYTRSLHLMLAQYEEHHGMARRALDAYRRAAQAVPAAERLAAWQLCAQRAASLFGVAQARAVYAEAVDDARLTDREIRVLCLEFATLERKLGEVDRARAIFGHAAQVADPQQASDFWNTWNTFEVQYGNEDTFREMLRIKRSVAAQYNTAPTAVAGLGKAAAATATPPPTIVSGSTSGGGRGGGDAMAGVEASTLAATTALTAKKTAMTFVRAEEGDAEGGARGGTRGPTNTAEIALDSGSESESEESEAEAEARDDSVSLLPGAAASASTAANTSGIAQQDVPAAVFGGLGGARERFQAAAAAARQD